MNHWIITLCALIGPMVIILDSGPAHAVEPRFSLGATVSAVTSTESTLLGDKVKLERVHMPEAHLTYVFTDFLSMELSYGRYQTHVESKSGGFDYGELTVSPIGLSLQHRRNFGHPPPYWDVGSYYFDVGLDYFLVDFQTDSEAQSVLSDPTLDIQFKNTIGAHAGAGFDLFLMKYLSLRLDAKVWFAQSDVEAQGVAGQEKDDFLLNAYSIGTGLMLFFP